MPDASAGAKQKRKHEAEAQPPRDTEAIELNRASWDEVVDSHLNSPMYKADLEKLRAGSHCLKRDYVKRLGSVKGKSLIHLQCHMGFETLSWARLGAEAVGLDFSQPAVEVGRKLAVELDLPARFVCADLYQTLRRVRDRFDIVFVSVGALCWLPDIDRWARIVAKLLKPGGRLLLDEAHPFGDVLDDHPKDDGHLIAKYPYFGGRGIEYHDDGTYADLDAQLENDRCVMWIHPLGTVINALIRHGLRIDGLHEYAECRWPRYKLMDEVDANTFQLPMPYAESLPMCYTLTASKA